VAIKLYNPSKHGFDRRSIADGNKFQNQTTQETRAENTALAAGGYHRECHEDQSLFVQELKITVSRENAEKL